MGHHPNKFFFSHRLTAEVRGVQGRRRWGLAEIVVGGFIPIHKSRFQFNIRLFSAATMLQLRSLLSEVIRPIVIYLSASDTEAGADPAPVPGSRRRDGSAQKSPPIDLTPCSREISPTHGIFSFRNRSPALGRSPVTGGVLNSPTQPHNSPVPDLIFELLCARRGSG